MKNMKKLKGKALKPLTALPFTDLMRFMVKGLWLCQKEPVGDEENADWKRSYGARDGPKLVASLLRGSLVRKGINHEEHEETEGKSSRTMNSLTFHGLHALHGERVVALSRGARW